MRQSLRCVVISVLWLAWLGLLPGTFVAAAVTGQGDWSRFWWMSSAVLVCAAWIHCFWQRRGRLGAACALIASGITLGMLADLYGAWRVLRFTEPLTMIVPLFALGHVCYVAGLLILAGRLQLPGQLLRPLFHGQGRLGRPGQGQERKTNYRRYQHGRQEPRNAITQNPHPPWLNIRHIIHYLLPRIARIKNKALLGFTVIIAGSFQEPSPV